jgi:hypothetical protein
MPPPRIPLVSLPLQPLTLFVFFVTVHVAESFVLPVMLQCSLRFDSTHPVKPKLSGFICSFYL